jgi:hypothetical protein
MSIRFEHARPFFTSPLDRLARAAEKLGIALDFEQPESPLGKLKAEAARLAGSGRREDFKLIQRLFDALPELKGA